MREHTFVGAVGGECTSCGLPAQNRRHVGEAVKIGGLEPLDAGRPRVGARHPETSRAAAALLAPNFGTRKRTVLDAIAASGAHGRSDDELEVELNLAHQSVSAARNSLMGGGWLTPMFEHGERVTRKTGTGSDATVWTLTSEGWTAWRKQR